MCGEISLPEVFSKESAPYYPFTGPTSMKVYIDKTDSHKGYTFKMEYDHKKVINYLITVMIRCTNKAITVTDIQ